MNKNHHLLKLELKPDMLNIRDFMFIYHYNNNTKEYTHKTTAEADPAETQVQGKFIPLIPACSTLLEPPSYGKNEIPVFEKNEWVIKPDYRANFVKVDNNFQVQEITNIGNIEGYYLVTKEQGESIKENPDKFKIVDSNIVEKSEEEYVQEQFIKAQQNKYAEITEKYDYANNYLIVKVDEELNLYANVSWYQTWSKVKSLAEQSLTLSDNPTIPSSVRFYKLTPDNKLYNVEIANLALNKLLIYYNIVQYAQFNVLQPIRGQLYNALNNANTIEDIQKIEVNFGLTLNEQDMNDVSQKVDLMYKDE